jgi:filamin
MRLSRDGHGLVAVTVQKRTEYCIKFFQVDASQSGTGQLEIAVDNGKIPCNFSSQGNLKFIPSFTPQESGKHEITVRFNSYEAPGSPFICEIFDVNKVGLVGYQKNSPIIIPIYKTNCVELNANDLSSSSIGVKLTSPSDAQIPVSRSITPQNTVKLTFQSHEIGTHRLEIDYANVPITGSPFDIKVFDSSRIIVSEIKGTEVNKPSEFTIDATGAGEGQLEIAINDGLIKNQVKQIKPGLYGVTFVPTKQDTYIVDVKFNQENVPGLF